MQTSEKIKKLLSKKNKKKAIQNIKFGSGKPVLTITQIAVKKKEG